LPIGEVKHPPVAPGRLNDEEVENLAAEFSLSPQVILHQVENHGLGYVEP